MTHPKHLSNADLDLLRSVVRQAAMDASAPRRGDRLDRLADRLDGAARVVIEPVELKRERVVGTWP